MKRSKREKIKARNCGKTAAIKAFVRVMVPSATLGEMNVLFTTDDVEMKPERTLVVYAIKRHANLRLVAYSILQIRRSRLRGFGDQ